jgi:Glyoxalase-like domain
MTQEIDGPFPVLHQVALDTTDARRLAEFYRQLLGYTYRAGDEPPPPGEPDQRAKDWLVLCAPDGSSRTAFQPVDQLLESTWAKR